jgi:hypothetical protein
LQFGTVKLNLQKNRGKTENKLKYRLC